MRVLCVALVYSIVMYVARGPAIPGDRRSTAYHVRESLRVEQVG